MRVLVTGASGMLGTDLTSELASYFEVSGVGLNSSSQPNYLQADLSEPAIALSVLNQTRPQIVFHTAAMTDVDGCETQRAEALKANYEMTRAIADACKTHNALLIFFSTDYVFSGNARGEIPENFERCPLSYYGQTKFLAEQYLEESAGAYIIFRITWLYGMHGKSFPRTILEKAASQQNFKVVDDQEGRPTYTKDLAEAIRKMLQSGIFQFENKRNTIYHLGNTGNVTWADFAAFILKAAGFTHCEVQKISSAELNRPAQRPSNSVLRLEKARTELGVSMRSWQEAVVDFISEFKNQKVAT